MSIRKKPKPRQKKNTLKIWLDSAVDLKYNNDKFQKDFRFKGKKQKGESNFSSNLWTFN
jgi:hypothetical protein